MAELIKSDPIDTLTKFGDRDRIFLVPLERRIEVFLSLDGRIGTELFLKE